MTTNPQTQNFFFQKCPTFPSFPKSPLTIRNQILVRSTTIILARSALISTPPGVAKTDSTESKKLTTNNYNLPSPLEMHSALIKYPFRTICVISVRKMG